MGLLISINGADFEPYHSVVHPAPLIKEADRLQKTPTIQYKEDSQEPFSETLKQTTLQKGHIAYQKSQVETQNNNNTRKATFAKDLMKFPVITLSPKDSIFTAKRLLAQKQIRHIPITDENEKVVGIISDRDLALGSNLFSSTDNQENLKLKTIMSQKVIAAQAKTSLHEIAKTMIEQRINSLPVLDFEQKVIGIITSTDILKSVLKNPIINFLA